MNVRQTRRFGRLLATITSATLLLLSGLAAAQVAPVELAPVERRAIVDLALYVQPLPRLRGPTGQPQCGCR